MAQSAMGTFFGKESFEIAASLVTVALIALLVSNSKGAVDIITGTADSFGNLLKIVTLQGRG